MHLKIAFTEVAILLGVVAPADDSDDGPARKSGADHHRSHARVDVVSVVGLAGDVVAELWWRLHLPVCFVRYRIWRPADFSSRNAQCQFTGTIPFALLVTLGSFYFEKVAALACQIAKVWCLQNNCQTSTELRAIRAAYLYFRRVREGRSENIGSSRSRNSNVNTRSRRARFVVQNCVAEMIVDLLPCRYFFEKIHLNKHANAVYRTFRMLLH